jgi:hypothetical protein
MTEEYIIRMRAIRVRRSRETDTIQPGAILESFRPRDSSAVAEYSVLCTFIEEHDYCVLSVALRGLPPLKWAFPSNYYCQKPNLGIPDDIDGVFTKCFHRDEDP